MRQVRSRKTAYVASGLALAFLWLAARWIVTSRSGGRVGTGERSGLTSSDRLVDQVGAYTFPASDPSPVWTGAPSGLSGGGIR